MGKQHLRRVAIMSACVLAMLLCRAATAQISVTSGTPNNAPQETTGLNVTVSGSGFEKGAKATWYVTGTTQTGGVTVNSTTFVNSTQLVANITIAADATVSGYDIQVANSNGRTGVGSDLFTVNPEAVTSTLYSTDASGAAVTVQGDNSSGTSTYANTPENCSTFDPHNICIIMSLLPNDWYLRQYSGSGRTVYLTFTALGNSPNESALDGYYLAQVATRCFDASNNKLSIPLTILPGTSNNRCSLRVNFTAADGANYLYIMSPIYAGTGWSTVACTSGTGTETCNAWTITPTPGSLGPNPTVANLYKGSGKKQTLVGTYEMTFNIKLTQ